MVSPEIDVSGNDNLPLIPPDRTGVSLGFTSDRVRAHVDYVRASRQHEVADFELPSEGYDDLRARIAWRFRPGDATVDLYLAGRNLTDDEQRLHTSVVKDLAPQPGRTIETGLRMRFQGAARPTPPVRASRTALARGRIAGPGGRAPRFTGSQSGG